MTVKLEGFEELSKKITNLESMKAVGIGLGKGAQEIQTAAEDYPPQMLPRAPRAHTWTDKQRKWFFANLRAGNIEVPYQRGQSPGSQRHNQSWTTKATNHKLTWTVGSNTTYGPILQDETHKDYSRYLASHGWANHTIQKIAKKQGPAVLKKVEKEVERLLNK